MYEGATAMATDAFSRIKDRSTDDEHKHSIRLRFYAQRRPEARVKATPYPRKIVSVRTDQENRASVGDFIRIVGKNLYFDSSDARSGVFFIDGGETRSAYYAHVSPELVIARVPDGLSSGPYLLRLRCASGGTEYREGRASSVFTVE
jgi:hypothetical protein